MDIDPLPLVLCGPVLRRVARHECFVWIALSRECDVRLEIYDSAAGEEASPKILAASTQDTNQHVCIGERLHIYLLKASGELPRNTILEYDVFVGSENLEKLGLGVLALPGFKRPSFFLSEDRQNLIVGSCRKPHGGLSEPPHLSFDALAHAWTLLKDSASDLSQRPSTLLLLGDQIYADDVAGPLLESLKVTSALLMGTAETIRTLGCLTNIPYGSRWEATYRIGFSSGHAHHHLLSLGEYCAMYLAVYGGFHSPLPAWDSVKPRKLSPELGQKLGSEYATSRACVDTFLRTSACVRALLANVATYTIFDDHEVTDDWNLDRRAYENAFSDAGAQRVVGNALCAYWAFQGWGNNPSAFDPQFIQAVERGSRRDGVNPQAEADLDELLTKFDDWHYVTATEPQIIFLDTRTHRRYVGVLGIGQLAGPEELAWLCKSIASLSRKQPDSPVYICAVTPVLGFMPIEWLQGAARRPFKSLIEAADLDFESWIAQRDGYFELMRTLMDNQVERCVFVSGDVHYGFVKRGCFKHRGDKCDIIQIVSSALNNEPSGGAALGYLRALGTKLERRVGFLGSQFANKLRRALRPFVYDLAAFSGLYRPTADDGQTWCDESRMVKARDGTTLTSKAHFVLLHIENEHPLQVQFRSAAESTHVVEL